MDFEIRYANNLDVLIAIYVDEELPNGGTTIARRTFAIPIYRTFATPKFGHLLWQTAVNQCSEAPTAAAKVRAKRE